jgi:hypothetical protein
MKTASPSQKYRPLLLAGLALVALPFVLPLLGLSLNTGTMVVILAIAVCASATPGWCRSATAPGSASAPTLPG